KTGDWPVLPQARAEEQQRSSRQIPHNCGKPARIRFLVLAESDYGVIGTRHVAMDLEQSILVELKYFLDFLPLIANDDTDVNSFGAEHLLQNAIEVCCDDGAGGKPHQCRDRSFFADV